MNKLINKTYIVSIDRIESLVQIKMDRTSHPLNYHFNSIEQAIEFVSVVINSVGFINLDEICKEVKEVKEVVKTPTKARVRKPKK